MGINGLLKGLQCYSQKRHVRDFSNQALAVDASSWLHKSVYSISERYVESTESSHGGRSIDPVCVQTSTKYVVARCQELLLHAQIARIYLVMDGKRCPLKAQTNQDREDRRQKNLKDARRYKREGRRDKAQEKYKACIKIHSDFATAVAEAVAKRFSADGKVQCIYAPYEADAQLVKMCIDGITHAIVTEDSDVLVYSASCHVSIPILYKLERDTGQCDVISMEWLLSPESESSLSQHDGSQRKSGGALESILRSLASRQLRGPGVGTRLFVQACVLAGCDYAPNTLSGVGLVSAFKLLRDNAHRPSGERFRHVLASLSKKAQPQGDMIDYEELLAKSEAVFYYHPVLQLSDRTIVTLTEPQLSEPSTTADLNQVQDHNPSMARFDPDWTFLGDMGCVPTIRNSLRRVDASGPEQGPRSKISIPHDKVAPHRESDKSIRSRSNYDAGLDAVTKITEIVNPYMNSRKRKQAGHPLPLSTIDADSHLSSDSNPFSKFARDSQQDQHEKRSTLGMYLHNRQDVRFVKRKFSEAAKKHSYVQVAKELRLKDAITSYQRNYPTRTIEEVVTDAPQHPRQKLSCNSQHNASSKSDDADLFYFTHSEDSGPEADTILQEEGFPYESPVLEANSRTSISTTAIVNCTDDPPYGNPSFDEDFSAPNVTLRRVTLDGPNAPDLESPLYNEFDSVHNNIAAHVVATSHSRSPRFTDDKNGTGIQSSDYAINRVQHNIFDEQSRDSDFMNDTGTVDSSVTRFQNDFPPTSTFSSRTPGLSRRVDSTQLKTPSPRNKTSPFFRLASTQSKARRSSLLDAFGRQQQIADSPEVMSPGVDSPLQPTLYSQSRYNVRPMSARQRSRSCREEAAPKPGTITHFFRPAVSEVREDEFDYF